MDDGYINEAYEVEILKPKNLTITEQSVKRDFAKYWDKDYINNRLDLIQDGQARMLLKFLWMSGVRITEAVTLRKGDIDIKNYVMVLKWLKSRKYKSRVCPIHPVLRDILAVYISSFNQDERIFPISRQRAWQLCKQHLNGHPHQLRHSFAVNWLRCGGDIIVLHRILGHSKIQTTMEYLKIVPVDQGKELSKISF